LEGSPAAQGHGEACGYASRDTGAATDRYKPKVRIGFRLDADLAGIRASGPGYSERVEKVLRATLAKGQL
jgi:uncharacterized protein (DUF4415 family)